MHTYEIAVKTRLIRKNGWTAILFAVFWIQTRLDKFPIFARRVQISIPTFRLAKLIHLAALPCILVPSRGIASCWQHSHCSHWLPGASVAPAQPAAIWPPFPPSPNPLCNPTQAQSGLKLLIPLMQPCFQAAGYIPVSQTRSSPVNPSFVLPALCFAHSFQFTWPKECACWNSAACTSCSALLSGSHQWQVSFFEISHTTASVPSGLSSAICQSVIFHLDCNAAKHRAFAVTWLLISRCRTMFSLFLL